MSECKNRFEYSGQEDCTRAHSAGHNLLRASAIVATAVFISITIVLLVWTLYKRREVFGRFRSSPNRVHIPPALFIWSGATTDEEAPPPMEAATQPPAARANTSKKSTKAAAAKGEPVSCVIMAGEARPTHLARPLPREDFVDVNLDSKLDELERGKPKAITRQP